MDKVVLSPGCIDHWDSFLKIQPLACTLKDFYFRCSGEGTKICALKHSPGAALSRRAVVTNQ